MTIFSVMTDADDGEVRVAHALAANSLAITQSMNSRAGARVLVDGKVACVARDGRLFAAADERRQITPAEAVRSAELIAQGV
jgi:hypothetical protein